MGKKPQNGKKQKKKKKKNGSVRPTRVFDSCISYPGRVVDESARRMLSPSCLRQDVERLSGWSRLPFPCSRDRCGRYFVRRPRLSAGIGLLRTVSVYTHRSLDPDGGGRGDYAGRLPLRTPTGLARHQASALLSPEALLVTMRLPPRRQNASSATWPENASAFRDVSPYSPTDPRLRRRSCC